MRLGNKCPLRSVNWIVFVERFKHEELGEGENKPRIEWISG